MKKLVYTFRTYPWLDELKSAVGQDIFIFGNLKIDLDKFKILIDSEHPDSIIGIAKSPRHNSQLEPYAINIFNGKKIDKESSKDLYELCCPNINNIMINNTPTNSFCNWTMFKIAQYLDTRKCDTKFTFIHIKKEDLSLLSNFDNCKL